MRQSYSLFLLVSLTFIAGNGNAQVQSDSGKTNGKVLPSLTVFPVSFSDFVNLNRNVGATRDGFKGYMLEGVDKDTNSSLSVGNLRQPMPLFTLNWNQPTMVTHGLLLDEDEGNDFVPRRWRNFEEFKHDFLALKLTDTQTDRLTNYLAALSKEAYFGLPKPSGIGFGEDWYHQQKRKLNEYLATTGRKRMADEKLNPVVVMREVHCSEKMACEFLLWLKADTEYVIDSKQYDLLVYVKEKYEVWCKTFNKC